MGKKFGNDYRVFIEDPATPDSFAEIKGQTDFEIDESGGTVDTSSKSDFPYGSSGPGARSLSASLTVIPDLPDANGYTRLETAVKSASPSPIRLQLRKGGSAGADPGDVVHECQWYCTARPRTFGMNAAVSSRFNFVNAAAPTVDALA